jgi:hypothetical protein
MSGCYLNPASKNPENLDMARVNSATNTKARRGKNRIIWIK